jgi:hypothetical protein
MEREALWRLVVEVKYDNMWGGWCSKEVGSFRVGVWKNIRRGWGGFLDLSDMRWEMGPISDFGMICGVGTRF